MATEVIFPKIGFSMTEGQIAEWMFGNGEQVTEGECLFLLEADKSSPWLCGGEEPTIADFAFATEVYNAFIAKDWGVKIAIPPAVQANIDALYALPAVIAFRAAEPK